MSWTVEVHLVRPDGSNANFSKKQFDDFSDAIDAFEAIASELQGEEK